MISVLLCRDFVSVSTDSDCIRFLIDPDLKNSISVFESIKILKNRYFPKRGGFTQLFFERPNRKGLVTGAHENL